MASMLLYVLMLLFGIVAAQERDKFCVAPNPPLPLPACTRQCLIGENKVLDGNCADNLGGFCQLSDVVPLHFKKFGPCLLEACPSLTDRKDYVAIFRAECDGTGEFKEPVSGADFNYMDLLAATPSGGIATSTEDATSRGRSTSTKLGGATPIDVSPEPTATTVTIIDSSSESLSTSTSTLSLETEKPPDAPTQRLPPAASTPPSSTSEGNPTSAVVVLPPNNTGPTQTTSNDQNDATLHTHVTVASAPYSTATAAAAPAFSTTAIAGTAAGGTVGIALIIGLIFLFLRRRKRRASLASSADMWEPSRNTSPKPKLPTIDHDTSFGRYLEVGPGAPMRQRSKAELHSEDIPRPQTAHNGYSDSSEMCGGSSGRSARYYRPAPRPGTHRHGSNMDSRYPEMGSHAATSMSSPTSPVSAASTMQGWHGNSPSGVPTVRISSADLRSEGMRSPVSELGTNAPLRSTRSVELHGAETMSPMSELGTENSHSGGSGAAEMHTESTLPPKLGPRDGGDMTAVIAEMEGSNMQKAH